VADPRNLAALGFWTVLLALTINGVQCHARAWAVKQHPQHHSVGIGSGAVKPPAAAISTLPKTAERRAEERATEQATALQGSFQLCGLCWLVLPMVPASNLFFVVGTLIAERLLYLPSVGYSLLLADVVLRILRGSSGFGVKLLLILVSIRHSAGSNGVAC
jgi:hypothetical protein